MLVWLCFSDLHSVICVFCRKKTHHQVWGCGAGRRHFTKFEVGGMCVCCHGDLPATSTHLLALGLDMGAKLHSALCFVG